MPSSPYSIYFNGHTKASNGVVSAAASSSSISPHGILKKSNSSSLGVASNESRESTPDSSGRIYSEVRVYGSEDAASRKEPIYAVSSKAKNRIR